jgi:hypothetical protein
MTVAQDVPRTERTAGRKQREPRRQAGKKNVHCCTLTRGLLRGRLWSLANNRLASRQ